MAAVNAIRLNDQLKQMNEAKEIEIACRSNLALCNLTLKNYGQVIEQCEKVLEHDPKNAKCAFRMA